MRRNPFVLLALGLLPLGLYAQNTLTVHQKDGEHFSLGFEEKPVVTFTDTELVFKSTKTELRYALAVVAKFTFDDVEDAVIGIKSDATKASITLGECTVSITGAKADVTVSLIASDGKQLQTYRAGQDGSLTFSIADLPQGTYIIISESLTCKILKK
jgi:hypothetical protein